MSSGSSSARWLSFGLCLGLAACGGPDTSLVEAEPGAPLPGLSSADLQRFTAGMAFFQRPYAPEEGLGPIFNQTRCSSCHDLPTTGGHGAEPVTKVSHFDPMSGCSLLEEDGGDLLQASVVPALREAGVLAERIPASATAVTSLRPPPLYGLGLVGAVEEEIRRRAEPTDRDGDGISGRLGQGPGGALGRFGAKGQHATLEAFIEGALSEELGLTSPGRPTEQLPNGVPLPEGVDPAPEPEVDDAQIALLADYVRFLAPPAGASLDDPDEAERAREGALVFEELGCAICHTPTMVTGSNEIPALDRKRFRIYSDLLLHDMGPETADICAPGAEPSEWLTTRLVGLRFRTQFLHNERAQGLESAILLHGGEGSASRDRYRALDAESRERLMSFLRSL